MLQFQVEGVQERSIDLDKNNNYKQRTVNIDSVEENNIILMDISSDKKWICYVSQYADKSKNTLTTTLGVRRFTALDEDTARTEHLNAVSRIESDQEETVTESETILPTQKDLCIDQYFHDNNDDDKFLSISPCGKFVTISTYNSEMQDMDRSCIVFIVGDNKILFHCLLNCNGRAVFLDRERDPCLAIMNTTKLRVYRSFTRALSYDLYDLTFIGLPIRHTNLNYQDPEYFSRAKTRSNFSEIINATSAFIKGNILLSSLSDGHCKTRFWSLMNDGVCISSISAPEHGVIAVSEDLKYAATVIYTETETIIDVHCLESGCLAHRLRSHYHTRISHALFCCNSRYLALTGVEVPTQNTSGVCIVNFQVMYIQGQATIYSTTRSMGYADPSLLFRTGQKIVNPFVYEEKSNDGGNVLKGIYSALDAKGVATVKRFRLDIDGSHYRVEDEHFESEEQNTVDIDWFNNIEAQHNDGRDVDVSQSSDKESDNEDISTAGSIDDTWDDYLDWRFYSGVVHELTNNLDDYDYIKCGSFEIGGSQFLIRCGRYIMQLWQLSGSEYGVNASPQLHQLLYISAYSNADYRSFYLSPNVWRLERYKNIKIVANAFWVRVKLDIVEDKEFTLNNNEWKSCIEELIMPIFVDSESFNYHKFESACKAVYYMNIYFINKRTHVRRTVSEINTFGNLYNPDVNNMVDTQRENNEQIVFGKTIALIKGEIEKVGRNCTSFQTTAGSKTLSMLASFEDGRKILKLLLKKKVVAFNLLIYEVDANYAPPDNETTERMRYSSSRFKRARFRGPWGPVIRRGLSNLSMKNQIINLMKESILTISIRERQYQLYHLIYNRIISDSGVASPQCLMILNDALILLQKFGYNDLYERSFAKLSYLPAGDDAFFSSEAAADIPYEADLIVERDFLADLKNVYCFSVMEQIPKFSRICVLLHRTRSAFDGRLDVLLYKWNRRKSLLSNSIDYFKTPRIEISDRFVKCVIPFPHFNTYYRTNVFDAHFSDPTTTKKTWNSKKSPYKPKSDFLQSALDQHREPSMWKQQGDIMAIMLQYKWKSFIRNRFYTVCIIYLIYCISYTTSIQSALEMRGHDSANANRSLAANSLHLIFFFFLSGTALFYIEFCQISKTQKCMQYFRDWHNLIHLAAVFLPLINLVQLTKNWDHFKEVANLCVLVLCLSGISRLQVYLSASIALEVITQLFRKVLSILFILFFTIVAVTYLSSALRSMQLDQYRESPATENSILHELGSSDRFSDPFKTLYQAWISVFGVWNLIATEYLQDNTLIIVIGVVSAFATALILKDVLNEVDKVKIRLKNVCITHFAATIAEIENLTFESTRHNRVNNPALVYYMAEPEEVLKVKEHLRRETENLIELIEVEKDSW